MEGKAPAFSAPIAADASTAERAEFITKTYAHLAGAVGAFVLLLFVMVKAIPAETAQSLVGNMVTGYNWLIVLGVYMVASTVANRWALSATSVSTQYMGLGLYIVAMAAIMYPLIYIAAHYQPNAIPVAAVMTLALFGGLTVIVFVTRQDFSFMRGALMLGGLVAIGLIVCSIIFGFQLGILFTVAMIGLMCGYILYDTSNVLHHYHIGQHVAAALALFSALATLFWYVLMLVMSRE